MPPSRQALLVASTFLLILSGLPLAALARTSDSTHFRALDAGNFSGEYRGLLLEDGDRTTVGAVRLVVNRKGGGSISLQLAADDRRVGRVTIARSGEIRAEFDSAGWSADLQADSDGEMESTIFSGTVVVGDRSFSVSLARRISSQAAAPLVGLYTMVAAQHLTEGTPKVSRLLPGGGVMVRASVPAHRETVAIGALFVAPTGAVRFVGFAGGPSAGSRGRRLAQGTSLVGNGSWLAFTPSARGGALGGRARFADHPASDFAGDFGWRRSEDPDDSQSLALRVRGSRYLPQLGMDASRRWRLRSIELPAGGADSASELRLVANGSALRPIDGGPAEVVRFSRGSGVLSGIVADENGNALALVGVAFQKTYAAHGLTRRSDGGSGVFSLRAIDPVRTFATLSESASFSMGYGAVHTSAGGNASSAELSVTRLNEPSATGVVLGGTGSVGVTTTSANGGTLSPGSSAGVLTMAGELNVYEVGSSGATLTILPPSTLGIGSGTINLSGGTLSLGLVKTGAGAVQSEPAGGLSVINGTWQASDTIPPQTNGSTLPLTGVNFAAPGIGAVTSLLDPGLLVLDTGSASPLLTVNAGNVLFRPPGSLILCGAPPLQTGLLFGAPGAVSNPSFLIIQPPNAETSLGDSGPLPSP